MLQWSFPRPASRERALRSPSLRSATRARTSFWTMTDSARERSGIRSTITSRRPGATWCCLVCSTDSTTVPLTGRNAKNRNLLSKNETRATRPASLFLVRLRLGAVAVDELLQLRTRHGADDPVDDLACLEDDESWDRSDLVFLRSHRVIVDI